MVDYLARLVKGARGEENDLRLAPGEVHAPLALGLAEIAEKAALRRSGLLRLGLRLWRGIGLRRMEKADVKRMLAIYFEASMNGEEMPDIEGENYLEVIENV